jgi:hypothetical protein
VGVGQKKARFGLGGKPQGERSVRGAGHKAEMLHTLYAVDGGCVPGVDGMSTFPHLLVPQCLVIATCHYTRGTQSIDSSYWRSVAVSEIQIHERKVRKEMLKKEYDVSIYVSISILHVLTVSSSEQDRKTVLVLVATAAFSFMATSSIPLQVPEHTTDDTGPQCTVSHAISLLFSES